MIFCQCLGSRPISAGQPARGLSFFLTPRVRRGGSSSGAGLIKRACRDFQPGASHLAENFTPQKKFGRKCQKEKPRGAGCPPPSRPSVGLALTNFIKKKYSSLLPDFFKLLLKTPRKQPHLGGAFLGFCLDRSLPRK